jgi:small subunit ribosomal protein S17
MKETNKKVENKKVSETSNGVKTVVASRPKILRGIVVSTKMKDTVVVKVERFEKVAKYQKYVKISKKYKAHDAGNTKKEGETIDIIECRPISKDKHFKVVA